MMLRRLPFGSKCVQLIEKQYRRRILSCFLKHFFDHLLRAMDVNAGQITRLNLHEVTAKFLRDLSRNKGLATAGWPVQKNSAWKWHAVPSRFFGISKTKDNVALDLGLQFIHTSHAWPLCFNRDLIRWGFCRLEVQ